MPVPAVVEEAGFLSTRAHELHVLPRRTAVRGPFPRGVRFVRHGGSVQRGASLVNVRAGKGHGDGGIGFLASRASYRARCRADDRSRRHVLIAET